MPIKYTIHNMSRLRKWLFLYATRIVEFTNGLFILAFSMAFILDFSDGQVDMYQLPTYQDFATAGGFGWFLFFALGIAQLAAMSCKSIRSNKASAILLMLSGACWGVIAGTFVVPQGLITTAPWVYAVWSFITCLAGYELLTVNKKIEGIIDGEV